MRHRTKRLVGLVAAGLAAAGLTACGAGGSSQTAGAQTGTLIWYVNNTPTLTPAVYAQVATGFTKTHSGVHVRVINQGGQDLGTVFQTLLSSGNTPDVGQGIAITPQNAKDFVDLSGQAWARQLAAKDQLAPDYEVNGKIYTLPVGFQLQNLVFYNKSLFTRAGIAQPPTTLDALGSDMAKLKRLGVVPMATSGTFIAGAQIEALAWATIFQTTPHWEAAKMAGTVSFAGSAWNTVMAKYASWIKAGYLRSDAVGLQFNTVNTDFLDGQYGMYLAASWFTGNIAQTPPKFPIGVFAVPTLTGTTPPPQAEVGAFDWEIPQAAPHRALAEEFVHYLDTSQQAIAPLVQADGDFTPTPLYPLSGVATQIQQIASATRAVSVPGAGDNVEPPGFNAEEFQAVQGLFVGKSAAQVAAQLDSWWAQNKGTGA
jgi:multiple sugar transport system substrate-binding protein/raffinose/stachyose/melibiose transport system substrate-binding protein